MEIISREEARAKGLKRYFTGEPCVHGHVCERYVSSDACVECERARRRAYRQTPRGRANDRARKQTPKRKTYDRAYDMARHQTPEYKEYDRARKQTPKRKAYDKAYKLTPECRKRDHAYIGAPMPPKSAGPDQLGHCGLAI